jgi:hypothetical protein
MSAFVDIRGHSGTKPDNGGTFWDMRAAVRRPEPHEKPVRENPRLSPAFPGFSGLFPAAKAGKSPEKPVSAGKRRVGGKTKSTLRGAGRNSAPERHVQQSARPLAAARPSS